MSKETPTIKLENARRLYLRKQRLAGKVAKPTTEDVLSLVRDLCYVQWDPMDVVAPSHIISLWSRLGSFRLSDLDRLLWRDRRLFLYWLPIASIVLTEDYPIYYKLMRRYTESPPHPIGSGLSKARKFLIEHRGLHKKMLGELKKKGPLQLTQFQDYVRTGRSDGWTSGSDVSNMLRYLNMSGEVVVVGHKGLQNVWGLAEDFLPSSVDKTRLTEEEFEHEAAQRALRALGTAFEREIYLYFPRDRYRNLKKTLENLEREGRIHRVHVQGLGRKGEQYVHDQDLRLLESLDSEESESRVRLIAPFDNLLCDLGRISRLFGFEYIHENYLPASKRKFGTFVHPLLWGDKLIGRVDLRMDREKEKLNVVSVHTEPRAPGGREVSSEIAATLEQFGEFIGARGLTYPAHVPAAWKSALH
ncbi:MAG TPA: crosslink repair DNA glycosylase YcaQ family protein [Candidatus Angelobacter sp.]|nr:crosslink repair DNA glycosylase YcaQ family protein [Candidatus Angelobacter sp.]